MDGEPILLVPKVARHFRVQDIRKVLAFSNLRSAVLWKIVTDMIFRLGRTAIFYS